MSFFDFLEVLEKEPQIHVNKFVLIFLETDGGIIVLTGVMQEKLFDFSVEGFGLSQEFFFHLEGFLKLRVFF